MEWLENYGLSIISAALVAAIIGGSFQKQDTAGVLVKMIGGLFLAFTVIQPLASPTITDLGAYMDAFSESGADAAEEGENLAMDAYCSYIKSETEAYILDKAQRYGATLTVEVELDDGQLPCRATIRGNVSPYAKQSLAEMIEDELGISKEDQLWIG